MASLKKEQEIDLDWAVSTFLKNKWLFIIGTAAASAVIVLLYVFLSIGRYDIEVSYFPVVMNDYIQTSIRPDMTDLRNSLQNDGYTKVRIDLGANSYTGAFQVNCESRSTNVLALEKRMEDFLDTLWLQYTASMVFEALTNYKGKSEEIVGEIRNLDYLARRTGAMNVAPGWKEKDQNLLADGIARIRASYEKGILTQGKADLIEILVQLLPLLDEKQKEAILRNMAQSYDAQKKFLDGAFKEQDGIYRLFSDLRYDRTALESRLAVAAPYYYDLLKSNFNRSAGKNVTVGKIFSPASLFRVIYLSLFGTAIFFLALVYLAGFIRFTRKIFPAKRKN